MTDRVIVNLGSAGESYGLPEQSMLHVDLIGKFFEKSQRYLIADLHNLPLQDRSVDLCLCVGSVLNYCDASILIYQIGRILRDTGIAIVEFETTTSFDYLLSRGFGKSVSPVNTFYGSQKIKLWAYNPRYIQENLLENQLSVMSSSTFGHISPLVYLLGRNQRIAARFHHLDKIIRRVPWLKRYASNVIFSCQKTSQ
jgi:ubiquinone/menaquinone biosynthesis C-methylase UbiE